MILSLQKTASIVLIREVLSHFNIKKMISQNFVHQKTETLACWQMFFKKDVLKNFANFTKQLR